MAMNAVYARLVRRDHALIQLLDPPFDTSALEPGYIRGYVPGVRENGGQYTMARFWTAMAFAALGDNARALELTADDQPGHHRAETPEGAAYYQVESTCPAASLCARALHGPRGWTCIHGLGRLDVSAVNSQARALSPSAANAIASRSRHGCTGRRFPARLARTRGYIRARERRCRTAVEKLDQCVVKRTAVHRRRSSHARRSASPAPDSTDQLCATESI